MNSGVVWTNVDLNPQEREEFAAQIQPFTLEVATVRGTNLEEGQGDETCRTATIAFGQPAVSDLFDSQSLRWIHLTSAGYTRYDRDDLRKAFHAHQRVLTNSSGVYDDPCAQHALAFLLAHNRRLLPSYDQHSSGQDWIYGRLRPETRVLGGQNILLVGYGAIAKRLTELLVPFGCHIRGIRRTVSGDELVPNFPIAELHKHLPWADHIINILPASSSTERLFGENEFKLMKQGATFSNIGRGDTVDQEVLVKALHANHIAGAYLDVTTPEPLPGDHPLWQAPNCLITPHIAGGLQNEKQALLDHFLQNFARFRTGQKLVDVVY
jgi:phosphoglycerate dehydrogenase-like enzyme